MRPHQRALFDVSVGRASVRIHRRGLGQATGGARQAAEMQLRMDAIDEGRALADQRDAMPSSAWPTPAAPGAAYRRNETGELHAREKYFCIHVVALVGRLRNGAGGVSHLRQHDVHPLLLGNTLCTQGQAELVDHGVERPIRRTVTSLGRAHWHSPRSGPSTRSPVLETTTTFA